MEWLFKKLPSLKLQRGDTIVEVMISMAVLAIVVGAAYGASTRTFNSSLNSQYRDQAVSYAQQQLELIKEADNSNPSTISSYTTPNVTDGTPFCINPSTKAVQTGSNCVFNKLYTVSATYDSSSKRYQVTTSWQSSSSQTQQTVLYYKPADSFTGSTVACTGVNSSCTSLLTNPPSVQVSAAQPSVSPGVTDTITWSSINVKTGSCTATGPGTFPSSVDSSADPGTYPFSTNTPGSYTFKVSCTDNVGNAVSNSASVTVSMRVVTGSASSIASNSANLNGTVNPSGASTTYYFKYAKTSPPANTTSPSSAGAGYSDVGAISGISGLDPSTTYYFQLCATSTYGAACGAINSFTTSAAPPAITGYSVWPEGNIFTSQGVYRAVYWSASNTRSSNPCYINNYGWVGSSGGVGITVYPGYSYGVTCYNADNQAASYDFYFSYYASYATLYRDADFDDNFPGWTWGPVGETDTGVPGDTSALDVYGRAALHDNAGNCYTFQSVNSWTRYGFVSWYGLQNDNFGWISIGKDCSGY